MSSAEFRRFTIGFSEEALADLHRRLKVARRSTLPFDWSSGTNDSVLSDMAEYWHEWGETSDSLAVLAKLTNAKQ